MSEEKVGKYESHIVGLTIAAVIAMLIVHFVFDIPVSRGPLAQLFL